MRIGSLSPRRLSLALAFATSLVFGTFIATSPAPAYALTNCTVSDSVDAQEQALLTLINQYRSQNGKPALTLSTSLTRAAAWHVNDMATKNYFSHTDSANRTASKRVADCDGPSGIGENIFAGTNRDTAQEAFDAWKASAGHNSNMLNGNYKQIGIARLYNSASQYKWYWTTDFSTSSASGGSTPSNPQTASSMTSPAPGSQLGNTATFTWSAAAGAAEYRLYVGTTKGASNLKNLTTTSRSTSVTNLAPTTGTRTVYVRLFTKFGTTWYYRDYTYTARR